MDKKFIPLGIENFERIRRDNYYYIDKTMLIEDILKNKATVTLFTRPRRFGKTLNMSMIKYFFDINNKDENRKLFEGLKIYNNEQHMNEQGKYPVIFISLKDLRENNWSDCLTVIKSIVRKLYKDFDYITERMDEYEKNIYNSIKNRENDNDIKFSLKYLSDYLYEYYNQKVIILIDEYDAPIINAYTKGYYDEAANFFQTFFSSALKTNDSLQFGILTGITRIIREGIFSGLNNLSVNTVLNEEYSEYFGLTEIEVVEMLDYYKSDYKIDTIREWYNGYRFGKSEIYNPWSIIKYIQENRIGAYWINTSENVLINTMLDRADKSVFSDLKKVLEKENIRKTIQSGTTIHDLMKDEEIWQLFLYSGYLTIAEIKMKDDYTDIYKLKIPNREVASFFGNTFLNRYFGTTAKVYEMIENMENGNITGFETKLEEILRSSLSYFDLEKENEKIYHAFVAGIMTLLTGRYEVLSNTESGYGRYDMALIPLNSSKKAYILEFKISKTEKELEIKAEEALKQIEKNMYDTKLKDRNIKDIIKIGIAFNGKKVKVKKL